MAKFSVSMQTPGSDHADNYITLDVTGSGEKSIKTKVCVAGAEVLVERLRRHLAATTDDPNKAVKGTLAKSLRIREFSDFAIVEPHGKHHGKGSGPKTRAAGYRRAKTGQGTSHLRKRHGMTNATSAQDVGYYLEYGTPRMAAEHWMEKTVEAAEDGILEAMQNAWNAYVDEQEGGK